MTSTARRNFWGRLRFYVESPEITKERQLAKRWRAKKWSFGLRQPRRYFSAIRFLCQNFFDFMQTPAMTLKRRRLTPKLQQCVHFCIIVIQNVHFLIHCKVRAEESKLD
jgi:hypothetical protein